MSLRTALAILTLGFGSTAACVAVADDLEGSAARRLLDIFSMDDSVDVPDDPGKWLNGPGSNSFLHELDGTKESRIASGRNRANERKNPAGIM